MINFIKTVPLVRGKGGEILPEIRIANGTILSIEYPINIYSPSSGLCHQGVGGHFTYRFKSNGILYRILFTAELIFFDKMSSYYDTISREEYTYQELLLFIRQCNKDKTILYDTGL